MYKRESYIQKIAPFIDKSVIKVITGMRRTGKSTILRLLEEELLKRKVNKERILFINMESFENNHLTEAKDLHSYVQTKRKECGEKLYLFIDEVQEIQDWEKVINSFLANDEADIYITGSNSRLLSGELATLLTGRYVDFVIYPLVYSEFLQFRGNQTDEKNLFNDYILYGGLPGIHNLTFEKDVIYQYLSSIKDSVVLKDVVLKNNIRDVSLLEKILLFISDNIGNIFSARKIADYFKNERRTASVETIYNYLKYLESAFIINRASRYDLKGKKLLETNEKYYLNDLGLHHAILGYREKDINAYLENIVYIELKKRGYSVMIGKMDDYEIDFICEKNNERIYVQVCYLIADETVRERELRPFYKIKDNYPKYLLTMDTIPESQTDGIIRKYIPAFVCQPC